MEGVPQEKSSFCTGRAIKGGGKGRAIKGKNPDGY